MNCIPGEVKFSKVVGCVAWLKPSCRHQCLKIWQQASVQRWDFWENFQWQPIHIFSQQHSSYISKKKTRGSLASPLQICMISCFNAVCSLVRVALSPVSSLVSSFLPQLSNQFQINLSHSPPIWSSFFLKVTHIKKKCKINQRVNHIGRERLGQNLIILWSSPLIGCVVLILCFLP